MNGGDPLPNTWATPLLHSINVSEFVQQVKNCIHLFNKDELLVDLLELRNISVIVVDRKFKNINKRLRVQIWEQSFNRS